MQTLLAVRARGGGSVEPSGVCKSLPRLPATRGHRCAEEQRAPSPAQQKTPPSLHHIWSLLCAKYGGWWLLFARRGGAADRPNKFTLLPPSPAPRLHRLFNASAVWGGHASYQSV